MHRKILYTALALVMMAAMLPSPALPTAQAAPPAQPEAPNVLDTNRDEFESQSYGNNDGSQNWAGNWIETNDGGSPTGGDIQITGGELRIDNSGGNLPSIRRAVNANMASAQYATLSFE
ncbi:MAG: hypothetical protein ACK2U9_16325, partial [Anaerolineae bacterium]